MDSPIWTLVLPAWPEDWDDEGELLVIRNDAIRTVKEITAWSIHCQDVVPKYRKIRIAAVHFLIAAGLTKKEIMIQTGISEHRLTAVIKEHPRRFAKP